MTKPSIGEMIEAANPQHPRITPERLDSIIEGEHVFNLGAALRALGHPTADAFDVFTICALVLRNDFVVIGHSAPASPGNYNAEIGAMVAREKAVDKLWELEGYHLKSKIAGTI